MEDAGAGAGRRPEGAGSISLGGLVWTFLKLGCIGFGGGMAVIALMEQEVARRRRLISVDEFAHGVGLAQILGGFAVNTAIFVGYRLCGLIGGLLCAVAYITPSVLLVIGLSYLYFQYHSIPALQGLVAGLGPVVIALIVSAGWNIARHTARTKMAVVVASAATALGLARINTIWILLAAGALGLFLNRDSRAAVSNSAPRSTTTLFGLPPMSMAAVGPLLGLTGTFLKIGCVFFGGGFVLVPLLHDHLVSDLHYLTEREFLDGVAISNLTPGPIAVLATFAGYHVASITGALVATAVLFAPGIALMVVISHQYARFHEDRRAKRFLSGINPAVAGLVFATALLLAPAALASWRGFLLCCGSLLLLTRFRWHPAFVLAIGAGMGYLGVSP